MLLLVAVSAAVILSVLLLVFSAEYFSTAIPFRWELNVTRAYEQSLESEPPLETVVEANQALTELGQRIAPHLALQQDVQFSFHYLEDSTPNAFATLGGHIFVSQGLLEELGSENGLAMVLAHEMAHIQYRHPIQSLSRGAILQLVMAVMLGNQGSGSVQAIMGQTGLLTLLSFNRVMEQEADAAAINAMISLYGHTDGADEFFVKMQQHAGSVRWLEVFQTHPGLERRIEMIRAAAVTSSAVAERVALDPRLFHRLHAPAELVQ